MPLSKNFTQQSSWDHIFIYHSTHHYLLTQFSPLFFEISNICFALFWYKRLCIDQAFMSVLIY